MTNQKASSSTVLKYSPQKARLIINVLRGNILSKALDNLLYMQKGQTKKIYNLLKTAANNLKLTESEFSKYKIDKIVAEEAQKYYRIQPRARGSAFRIRRRFSRVKVWISPINIDNKSK